MFLIRFPCFPKGVGAGGICNGGLDTSGQTQNEVSKKSYKIRGYLMPKIIRGKPIFDLIPEESETASIIDPDNVSTISSEDDSGVEHENELISQRIQALETNDLTAIQEEDSLPSPSPQEDPVSGTPTSALDVDAG